LAKETLAQINGYQRPDKGLQLDEFSFGQNRTICGITQAPQVDGILISSFCLDPEFGRFNQSHPLVCRYNSC